MDSTRIDRWLWAVRVFKTRSAATAACKGGRVKLNGDSVKPATTVHVGDTVEASLGERLRIVEVACIIETRVGAPIAAECIIDRSPAPPPLEVAQAVPVRDRGSGRPSKRERRQLDRQRGFSSGRRVR